MKKGLVIMMMLTVWFIYDKSLPLEGPCDHDLGGYCFVTYCSDEAPVVVGGVATFRDSNKLKGGPDRISVTSPFTIKKYPAIRNCH